jgi:hypothetical protein
MSNPTSNFGWQMPTNTDLVSQLPADFEVFGQAVDTSLADLKGGTTGQVLKKNTNTDMDFVWSSDTGFANPMTTTGDTIYSSSGSTPARLAIGTTGQVLTVAGGVPTWASAGAGFVGCKANGQTGTFPHDTLTTINYSTDVFDTDGFHDESTNTNRFTVPSGKAGKYLCINNGMRLPNINLSDAYLTLRINGTEEFRQYPGNFPSNGRPSFTNLNVVSLSVGDYIDYAFYQASGSSTSILAGGFVIFAYLGA